MAEKVESAEEQPKRKPARKVTAKAETKAAKTKTTAVKTKKSASKQTSRQQSPSAKKTTQPKVTRGKKPARKLKPDAVLARAVEAALKGLKEVVRHDYIGQHLGMIGEAERLLTHYFACLHPGYAGWAWAVTMTRVPRSKTPTICEIELLPHEGALLAPRWLPWEQRMNPEDGSNDDDDDYEAAEDVRLTPGRRRGDHDDKYYLDVGSDRGESPWEVDDLRVNDLTLEVWDPAFLWAPEPDAEDEAE
ncbi:DUF3027 domain-containing protein [Boudabousia marimammalium]|uniref:DUF3027 domain-containing protein n=1 Tax=Boudabousia marimammalium TaxID=156892 RepID=A0A1Q5PL60_9ACTO|nr:DUF3027 domain-containing protein [Boudabousia marimammalium]OKL47375.1 hypothetical protein BM477_06835 [Boudabousia marimammalium]